ncbi:D-aspartate ligase [subsurface metagenome]
MVRQVGGQAVAMVAGEDSYLDVLSKNKSQLPKGLKCTFHGWDVVSTVREKHVTYQKCSEIGVNFPKTHYVRSKNELLNILPDLDIPFPVLLKPLYSKRFRNAFGTRGIVAGEKEEVIKAYHNYNGFFGHLLLTEYIPGGEEKLVNLIAVGDTNGAPVEVFMNRKVRSSGRFLGCTLMEDYYSNVLLKDSMKLMAHLGYYGYFNPEFKIDPRDGLLKLMEVNGRITISNSHSLLCGFNMPYAMYQCALGAVNPKPHIQRSKFSKRVLWWEPIGDSLACVRKFRKDNLSVRQYLVSLRADRIIMEPFWHKDPAVWIAIIWRYMKIVLNKAVEKLCGR